MPAFITVCEGEGEGEKEGESVYGQMCVCGK